MRSLEVLTNLCGFGADNRVLDFSRAQKHQASPVRGGALWVKLLWQSPMEIVIAADV
jgi:hypothetical protein